MRTSGARVSTSGRAPPAARNRSHTASLIRRVANSRLRSGERIAFTSTRIERSTRKRAGQSWAWVASYTSCSLR
jgi:hypothetical protein